ncbi:putative reverse transcriptase zinc-binding domain-containing protein [Helianthus debilis subsp. tardiflorus]
MEGWIPTATALARRSVNVGNERCPLCGIAEEDADHLLVACSFARSVWWSVLVGLSFQSLGPLNRLIRFYSMCRTMAAMA